MGGHVGGALTRSRLPEILYPVPMESAKYRDALRSVLDTASSVVESRLAAMSATATAHTEGIVIDVSLDQDGEGTFGVWARFEGSDAFSLNQQIGDERAIRRDLGRGRLGTAGSYSAARVVARETGGSYRRCRRRVDPHAHFPDCIRTALGSNNSRRSDRPGSRRPRFQSWTFTSMKARKLSAR